jgi:hypothetical protein
MTGAYQQMHDRGKNKESSMFTARFCLNHQKLSTRFSTPVDNFISIYYSLLRSDTCNCSYNSGAEGNQM